MGRGLNYTSQEDQILKDYYYEEGSAGCFVRLVGRTKCSIGKRAIKLGFERNRNYRLKQQVIQVFGDWIKIEYDLELSELKGCSYYKCTCKCENTVYIRADSLIKNKPVKNCGKCNPIVIGKIYNNYLVPIKRVEDYTKPGSRQKMAQYYCVCLYNGRGCKGYVPVLEQHLKNGNTKSCGCLARELFSINTSGKNHWNYKGGVSKIENTIRTSSEYIEWRELVYKRDNYICQYSGVKGQGNLNAHHIKPLHIIIKENNIVTMEQARKCKELWGVLNGITLLDIWHLQDSKYPKAFHSIYGNFEFTQGDFKEWFKGRVI